MTKTKAFDCVEMKRRGAERIYEQLKGKSIEEQVAFWQQKDREFEEYRKARRAERKAS